MASRQFARTLLSLLLVVCVAGIGPTCFAKKKKHDEESGDEAGEMTILEIDFANVTLDAGNQNQVTYKITKDTQVTLNGQPATTDDILAGMRATVQLAPDNQSVLVLTATNAKAIPNKGGR